MKVKLLIKLREKGRSQINIYGVTKSSGITTGMSCGYSDNIYSGLFSFGDTEDDVRNKACKIFLRKNMPYIKWKYKKYSRKYIASIKK